jgi:creatinine amidohydrolase
MTSPISLPQIALGDLPHREARALLAGGAPVYLAVNPVEYHGPHLSLRNDALISAGLTRDLHTRLALRHPEWPLIAAPGIELGVEPAPGPGSVAASYGALKGLVVRACEGLAALGARRLVLMTFHGSPLHAMAIEAGVLAFEARGGRAFSPLNLVLREMLSLDPAPFAPAFAHIADPAEREEMLRGLALDFHAGFFETSMALYYAPASVSPSYRELPPCPAVTPDRALTLASRAAALLGRVGLARELSMAAVGVGWMALRPFPGYTSRPARATSEAGGIFARYISDRYAEVALEIFSGRARSPQPILSWLPAATLGGRLGGGLSLSQQDVLA